MFQNNNNKIVRQLSQRIFQANKSRNIFAIIALILTTFMITSIFSIGFSYTTTNEQQQLRMMGTTAHLAITNVNKGQASELEHSSGMGPVSTVGLSHRIGSVEGNALLGLVWIDRVEWETHRRPTITGVTGTYPTAENEVMLPTWALAKLDITEPSVGMKLSLMLLLTGNSVPEEKTFVLSGYYTDYMQIRNADRGMVYVSAAFCESTGIPLENGGAAMITFRDSDNINSYSEQLKNRIVFHENQSFEPVPLYVQTDNSIIIVLAVVIAMIIVAGYLLIYNILYISISKDIRSYGQLKTLGTTKQQIKRLVRLQVLKISVIGIPAGLLLGATVSLLIVPLFLNVFTAGDAALGASISFSPLIFVFAGVFSFLTVLAASLKPARIAAGISPVEAMKFTGVQGGRNTASKSRCGAKVALMAWRNIFRNRKSAVLVFTSLFMGLALFLLSTGLLGSLNPANFVAEYHDSDITVTLSFTSTKPAITETMVEKVAELDGVQSINFTLTSAPSRDIPVTYTPETYGKYIDSLANNPELTGGVDFSNPEVIANYVGNFSGSVFGIDSVYADKLGTIDMSAFENGDIVLLCDKRDKDGNSLFEIGQQIEIMSKQTGSNAYKIGGFLPENFQKNEFYGSAPSIYMSKTALQKLSPENKIDRLDIDTDGKEDGWLLEEISRIFGANSEISITSRYEKELQIAGYITTCKVLGTGLAIILLLIGVMNFINTMFVSVISRKQELAVLESIGMTARQLRKMLIMEGVYYFIISFALVGTAGSALFVVSFKVLQSIAPYAVFIYPVVPVVIAATTILIVCIIVPLIAYQSNSRESVIERLRIE